MCISIYAHSQYDIVGVCELVIIRQRKRQPKRQRKRQSKSANNQLVHHAFHLKKLGVQKSFCFLWFRAFPIFIHFPILFGISHLAHNFNLTRRHFARCLDHWPLAQGEKYCEPTDVDFTLSDEAELG